MTDRTACFFRLLELGYSFRTAMRLARWATDPTQPVNKETR